MFSVVYRNDNKVDFILINLLIHTSEPPFKLQREVNCGLYMEQFETT